MSIGKHQSASSGSDTWLTPRHVLDAIGPFDLDPCAAPDPVRWPTAKNHFTYRDDGISQSWAGRVWLNPPYASAWRWVERLADHGDGIALLFARTETKPFTRFVWDRADALLFLTGRLTFHTADGAKGVGNSGAPSVLIAYGSRNVDALAQSGLAGYLVAGWTSTADVLPQPNLFG